MRGKGLLYMEKINIWERILFLLNTEECIVLICILSKNVDLSVELLVVEKSNLIQIVEFLVYPADNTDEVLTFWECDIAYLYFYEVLQSL